MVLTTQMENNVRETLLQLPYFSSRVKNVSNIMDFARFVDQRDFNASPLELQKHLHKRF